MGLAQCQGLLARLATDSALRARFTADPRGVGADFGLGPEEAERLAGLWSRQVDRFAAALLHKRRREVEKQLPLARRALGAVAFAGLFGRHAAVFSPAGVKKHRDDAVAFAAFVARAAQVEEIRPAWAVDLIRFEATTRAMGDPSRLGAVRRLRHPVGALLRAGPSATGPPPLRPTLVVWFRLAPDRPVRQLVLSLPWWPSP